MSAKRQWRYAVPALLAAVLLAGPVATVAGTAEAGALRVAQSDGLTLSQAVDQVRRRYKDARIVSAVTRVRGDREIHEIKVLTDDGTVKTERIRGRRVGSGRG